MPRKGKKIMPEQPPANQAQPQAQQSGQPQAHHVEQHLMAAGLPQQALDTARAHGLNTQQLLGLFGQLLPLILQFVQQARGGQGGGPPGASQISQPSGQQTTEPTQP
jgi:hypothetical protein